MALNPAEYASVAQSGGILVQGGKSRRGKSRRGKSRRGKSRRGKSRRGLRGGNCNMPAAVGGTFIPPPSGGGRTRRLSKRTRRVRHHRTKSYSAGGKRK
jgi:hypothetical protein